MSNYQSHWDLSTIPDPEFNSEAGRRRRSKGPAATRVNLKSCKSCGHQLNTRERRKPCSACGYIHAMSER